MKPSFDSLATFVAIAETGGLTAAARRLNLAKSVVSKRLADLEKITRTELVRRSTRQTQLTEAGAAFYVRAKHILAELDTAIEESAGAVGELRGSLRVAAPLTFSRLYLADIFVEFASRYPAVELSLDCDDQQVDIHGRGYDLAIRVGRLADSTLIARRLAPVRQLLVASPAYLDAHSAPQSLEDLGAHACIVYSYSTMAVAQQWQFAPHRSRDEPQTVAVQPRLTVNNGEIIRDAVLAGLGVAALPLFIISDALKDGRLVRVLPSESFPEAAIYAVWPPRPAPSRKLRALIDLLAVRVPERLAAAGALEIAAPDR